MDLSTKPKRVRIIEGKRAEIEAQLNELYDDWKFQSITISVVNGELVYAVIMNPMEEIRKQALAAASMPGRRQ